MDIKTHIGNAYYISTTYLVGQKYETMVFRIKKGEVDWSGIDQEKATSRAVAIHNHLKAIVKYTKGRTV